MSDMSLFRPDVRIQLDVKVPMRDGNRRLWQTSNIFLVGHRVRVEASSSHVPRFDRNLNTGHPIGLDAERHIAIQRASHDPQHPSHLLPIIPGES